MDYRIPLVNLKRHFAALQNELQEAAYRVLASGRYIGGEEVEAFESELAQFLRLSPEAVISCGNGTDALLIAYLTAGLRPGDEVIMPTHNYVAAAEAALLIGLKPVWADLTEVTDRHVSFAMCTDPHYLLTLCSPRTKALVAVNLYGMPAITPQLKDFCQKRGLCLIEDNAQGMGGCSVTTDGKVVPTGTLGDIVTTSFFPTKPLGGMGDGGAVIVPNNRQWQERAKQIARHGQAGRYDYRLIGMNSRLDALQAALLRVQLAHLPERLERVYQIARRYDEAWSENEFLKLEQPYGREQGATSAYYLYTLWMSPHRRDAVMQYLSQSGIESRIYYPQLLHQIPIYRDATQNTLQYPHAQLAHDGMLSIPIDPYQTPEETSFVIKHLTLALQTS